MRLSTETQTVPEWGGDVTVRAMDGHERAEAKSATFARIVQQAAIDHLGEPLFSEDDLECLSRKSATALVPLVRTIFRLSAYDRSAFERAIAEFDADPELLFWHRLALALGATVEELQERVSSKEFTRWMVFWESEPFGNEWRQTALTCMMVANSAGGKKGGGSFALDDFMPVKPRISQQQLEGKILAAFKSLGGVKRSAD